ncbi:MAG: PQQ-dependent sugar dehydrogenase, partial [Chitinophagaceae bacterium]
MKANYLLYLPLIAAGIAVIGCSANNTGKTTDATMPISDTSNAPVETNPPNTNYPPAFVGQTRVKGVHTTTAYSVDRIATKIGKPWAVIPMPGAKLLVTDKSGFMQIFSIDGTLIKKITGFPAVNSSGQGGLLDVALDPSF